MADPPAPTRPSAVPERPHGGGLDRTGLALYAAIVLVWGTSWILIRYQLGATPILMTVALRFWMAALLMFAILAWRREAWAFSRGDHVWFMGLGVTLFSLNFCLFYTAGRDLTTGLLAVVFSTATLFNMGLSVVVERVQVPPRVVFGGVLGVAGLVLIFWPEMAAKAGALPAIGLALGGTLSFSIGNEIAQGVRARGLPLIGSTAWGMAYGAGGLTLLSLALSGAGIIEPALDTRPSYWLALTMHAVFASVVAFLTYTALLRRIGTARAGYATVMFPVVALLVSTWIEDYVWTPAAVAGLALIGLGNVAVLTRAGPRRDAGSPAPGTTRTDLG